MEPDTQVQAPVAPQKHFINRVTTFSKVLAAIVFVALPIATLYLGYQKGAASLPTSPENTLPASETAAKITFIDSFERSIPDMPGALDFTILATSPNGEKEYLLDSHYEGWFENRIVYKDTNPYLSYSSDFGIYRTDPSIFIMPNAREKRQEWTSPSGEYLAVEAMAGSEESLAFCDMPEEPRKIVQVIELNTADVLTNPLPNDRAVSYSIERWVDSNSISVIARHYQLRRVNEASDRECLDSVISEEKKVLTSSNGILQE